jgi:excisionase family DNA binding protein
LTDRRLLTEREVAEVFTVSTRTVRRWATAGELTPVRIGGVTRYREDEVLDVIHPGNKEGRPAGNGTPLTNSAVQVPTRGS